MTVMALLIRQGRNREYQRVDSAIDKLKYQQKHQVMELDIETVSWKEVQDLIFDFTEC